MKQRIAGYIGRFSLSGILRGAFVIGTLMTLIVSCVSLYAWHAQNRQIRYALGDYFPRIQASFLIEGQLNTLVDELNEFLKAPDTVARLQLRNQITIHLTQIDTINQKLTGPDQAQISDIVSQGRTLLQRLDNALYTLFLTREKVNTMSARITWLHDDFNAELNSLSQDISWQQGSLLDQIEQDPSRAMSLQGSLRKVQGELQLIYTLARLEGQIMDDLTGRLRDEQSENPPPGSKGAHSYVRYLSYLRSGVEVNEASFDLYPSTVTLRQTIDELLDIGLSESKMPEVLSNYQQARAELAEATAEKDKILERFRTQLDVQLDNSHSQLQTLNQHLASIMSYSGTIIIITALLALLLAVLFNHYLIRARLVKRFTALNQAVARIGQGDLTYPIPLDGRDEIARVAMLLRQTLNQINRQKIQLEQEITDRKAIEENLRATQNELIQTAKLAVVGQTMTTLAHEINQPLNALSMHLYMAKRAVAADGNDVALNAMNKSVQLVTRMDGIIRSLRQFTRRRDDKTRLQPIDLHQSIQDAWDILALQHKLRDVTLHQPDVLPLVQGDAIGIQQVLVNIFANAMDAAPQAVVIDIDYTEDDSTVTLYIRDNGCGWPLALADSLMKPFTTSKEIGLGIGLSVSSSIMQQLDGGLRIASTLTRNGCVILSFKKVTEHA